jgi:hypothetical protein
MIDPEWDSLPGYPPVRFYCTIVFIHRLYMIMKTQDLFPYNSFIVGINNLYHTVDSNSFYINSNCILATEKKITIGKVYIILTNTTDDGFKMFDVNLVDCYYLDGIINLIVQDIRSQRRFTIDHCIEPPEGDCTWVLIDLNYFIDKMNEKAIKQYCGKCNDPQKKPNTEINHKSNHDDLLEFEF